jgi:hypothetical protein
MDHNTGSADGRYFFLSVTKIGSNERHMIPSKKPVAFSRGTKPVFGNSSFPGLHAVPNITSNSGNILQKFLFECCGSTEWWIR